MAMRHLLDHSLIVNGRIRLAPVRILAVVAAFTRRSLDSALSPSVEGDTLLQFRNLRAGMLLDMRRATSLAQKLPRIDPQAITNRYVDILVAIGTYSLTRESMKNGSGVATNICRRQYCIEWRAFAIFAKYGPVEMALGTAVRLADLVHKTTRVCSDPNGTS